MKKVYSLGLALFVGVAAMAADNGPRSHTQNRPVKENSTARTTVDIRRNRNDKLKGQEAYYSSRYGNDSWGRRNDNSNDNWAYARDRYNYNDRDHDHDRDYDRNDRYDHNNHGYGQNNRSYNYSKGAPRRY